MFICDIYTCVWVEVPDFICRIKMTDVLLLPSWCNFMDSYVSCDICMHSNVDHKVSLHSLLRTYVSSYRYNQKVGKTFAL